MTTAKKNNIGYQAVAESRENGRFASPNKIPLGSTLGIRLPVDLDEWVKEESKRRGCTKNELIREAVRFFQIQATA